MTRLNPKLTQKRRSWLERLVKFGPSRRDGTVVGFQCMSLGWTTWMMENINTGETKQQIKGGNGNFSAEYGAGWRTTNEEMITSAGRVILLDGSEGTCGDANAPHQP